jgi:hypothetical protein
MYSGTSLTIVMLVALPFLSSPATSLEAVLAGPTETRSAVGIEDRDSAIEALIAAAEDRASGDADADSDDEAASSSDPADPSGSSEPGSPETDADTPQAGVDTNGGTTPRPSPTPSATTAPPAPSEPATPACPAAIGGSTPGAPSATSPLGVGGTTSADLQSFAERFNAIRVANCLPPVPFGNIRYDSCMEQRLFWMAEDPSEDPMSAWGHIGSVRSDGVPSVGCDGNLAGGSGNTGATVAQKWWDSSSHRASLYKPTVTGSTGGVCILFAMTHGGVPNEPSSFVRAAARWTNC